MAVYHEGVGLQREVDRLACRRKGQDDQGRHQDADDVVVSKGLGAKEQSCVKVVLLSNGETAARTI